MSLVANNRDVTVQWRPFSLALKNDELEQDKTEHSDSHRKAHRILRVMQAAEKLHGVDDGVLYTGFGVQQHVAGREYDDELILDVLKEHKLPAELLKSADDKGYDAALQDYVEQATGVVGDDVGVPITVFELEDGDQNGFFGPVLQELPDNAAALELWDGLSKLAVNTSFYELKRDRPSAGPNVGSTARC